MSCPTCDHTMTGLGCGYYWCPRCGTLKEQQGMEEVTTPKLVGRCRKFEKRWKGQWMPQQSEWVGEGIAEAINRPADRPE